MERYPIMMQLEVRGEASAPVIEGYAAVFNSLSEDLGGFREQIAPGAFKQSLLGDVRALWNHDTGQVLGRTKAGTLQIEEDGKGLRVRITPPASASGLVESMRRGDVDQMSFGFTVNKDEWAKTAGGPVRTLLDVSLREVSVVPFPAYLGTSAAVRSLFGELPKIPELYRRAPVKIEPQADRRAPAAQGNDRGNHKGNTTMATATLDKLAPVDLRRKADALHQRAEDLDAMANAERREMSDDERAEYETALTEFRRLDAAATRAEELQRTPQEGDIEAPNINLGRSKERNEERAFGKFLRGHSGEAASFNLRASNAVDMVEGTPAAGGYAVPVGLSNRIIAKANDALLADKLGVRNIPGKGLLVNAVTQAGTTNPFVLTAEKAQKDKDSPTLAQVPFQLVKYTKVIPVTTELLEDNDANLVGFIEQYASEAMAETENSLLVAAAVRTAAPAGFTVVPLPAGLTANAADLFSIFYALQEPYASRAKWLMNRSALGGYSSIQGQPFVFNGSPQGGNGQLFGAPVYTVGDLPALGANSKSIIFADWSYMGRRRGDSIGFLRDPYSRSLENVVNFIYEFRAAYAVLQPEAGVVGQKAAA